MLKLEHLEARDVPSRTWYVAPNGTGDGSLAHPAGTVAAVEWQAQPGDEIHLRGGTYHLTQSVDLWAPGVALKAQPRETVVLDASQLPAGTTQAVAVTGNGVVVEGLQIVGSPRTGIAVWGASGVTLRNNTIRDSQGSGIYVGFDHAGAVKGVVVEGNTVEHNSLANAALTAQEGWAAAIAAQYTTGIQIRNNTVDHNFGEGIDIVLSDGAQVRGNTAFDNFSANYYLDNATNTIVDGNTSYTTNDSNYYRFGQPAVGVQLANEVYSTRNSIRGDIITNNLLLGGRYGVFYGRYGYGGGLNGVVIADNTIYGSVGASLRIDGDAHKGSLIEDNIFEQHEGYAMVDYNGADGLGGLTFRSNLWYGGTPEVGAAPDDVYANPLFVAPRGHDPRGFALQPDSPALHHNAAIVAADFFGNVRKKESALGAIDV